MNVLKPLVSSLLLVVLPLFEAWPAPAQSCSTAALAVQVLGSGELSDMGPRPRPRDR
jgi:hypothetical protein